jgi:hypothetical protein
MAADFYRRAEGAVRSSPDHDSVIFVARYFTVRGKSAMGVIPSEARDLLFVQMPLEPQILWGFSR